MSKVKVGDVELNYEREGAGPPILFIGGLAAGQVLWAKVVEHLKQDYECITFDNRGIGQSSKPASGYSIPILSGDSLGLLDSLSITRAHIVGMSMGGLIAQDMALQRPEMIGSLVLAGSFAKTSARGDLIQETRPVQPSIREPALQRPFATPRCSAAVSRLGHS